MGVNVLSPAESARVMRWIRRAADSDERTTRINAAPLPDGSSLSLRVPASFILGQDRVRLSSEMAASMWRVWGIAGSLRNETFAANTRTPASSQIVLRLHWLGDTANVQRCFFTRVAAYSAS